MAGIQSLILGSPPTAVAQSMGAIAAGMWTGLLICCPLLLLLGFLLRRHPSGIWVQIAAEAGAASATAAFVVAVLQSTWAERASFAAWSGAAMTAHSVLLLTRDLRRAREMARLVKEVRA
ncbi:hypothetical protein NDR87_31480 [Nocardia sp. CDC159]|uniref:Uncharacterized protein n=1 Tax=Nocardia pulmonis TaxID=2951408 RepID=A0A9X2EGT7_9NOCA|nr:hypothetical protein [Nocardia sp. CDC159]MCM6777928.1 hypothetical protein [Nocardia pulmonis]MCM6790901.1 hypothetical protein [Nocardia sp. CDC159]